MTDSPQVSLFDLLGFTARDPLFNVLSTMKPASAYRIMRTLRSAEVQSFGQDEWQEARSAARHAMSLAPELGTGPELDRLAAEFADYLAYGTLDDAFWPLFSPDKTAALEMVEIHGDPPRPDYPEVLLGVHTGPLFIPVPLMAQYFAPITLVSLGDLGGVIRSVHGDRAAGMDLDAVVVPDPGALRKCVGALKRGRSVVVHPDVPATQGSRTRVLPFLGTRITCSTGAESLGALARTRTRLFEFERIADARYRLTFHEVPDSAAVLDWYFEWLGRALREGRAGSWFGWRLFEQMVVPSS